VQLEDPGNKLVDHQLRERMAVAADENGFLRTAIENRYPQTAAASAAGRGIGRPGFGVPHRDRIAPSGLDRVEFKAAAALGAHVVEATLGLAGINDVATVALRTANHILEGAEAHEQIVSDRRTSTSLFPKFPTTTRQNAHPRSISSPSRKPGQRRGEHLAKVAESA